MDDSATDNTTPAVGLPIFEDYQCGEIYYDRSIFVNHLRTNHEEKPTESPSPSTSKEQEDRVRSSFNCITCQKEFSLKEELDVHISQNHTDAENEFTCDVCRKTFSFESNLKLHIKRFHEVAKPFACEKCGESFSLASDLESHHRRHYCIIEVELFTCEICEAEYTTKGQLMRHTRESHSTRDAYSKRKLCYREFSRQRTLKTPAKNVHINNREIQFRCLLCGEKVTRESDLEKHRNRVCIGRKNSYKCGICRGAEFITENDKLKHIEEIHGIKLHWCEYCLQGFARPDYLREHTEWIHNGDGPFRCVVCGEKFSQILDMEQHKKHQSCSNENAFTCEICKRTFVSTQNLKIHTIQYHARSIFKCEVPQCGITFLRHYDLEEHYRWIHSEERPSTSAGCSSEFTIQSISNNYTMQSHAGETPQICELCGEAFSDEGSLTEHILMHTARLFD